MEPLSGKTYSLYQDSLASDRYFNTIKQLADDCLQEYSLDEKELLSRLRQAYPHKNPWQKLFAKDTTNGLSAFIEKTLTPALSIYTRGVKGHLRRLSLMRRFDSTLRTTETQYHLYMLEIELVNRIYRENFKGSAYKFALLPHCLRDFRLKCLAGPGDIEYTCKGCTRECYIHQGSKILRAYGVEPYISITMDQERLFKGVKEKHGRVGVLGIACIPELARGMRLAIRLGIPPLGVPLDANRCSRWMGTAHESSFNLKELESLLI